MGVCEKQQQQKCAEGENVLSYHVHGFNAALNQVGSDLRETST